MRWLIFIVFFVACGEQPHLQVGSSGAALESAALQQDLAACEAVHEWCAFQAPDAKAFDLCAADFGWCASQAYRKETLAGREDARCLWRAWHEVHKCVGCTAGLGGGPLVLCYDDVRSCGSAQPR